MDNFWSLLERALRGMGLAVDSFHFDKYLSEQVFCYNNGATEGNKLIHAGRFGLFMSQVAGKPFTFPKLTGKDADSAYHLKAKTGKKNRPALFAPCRV